MVMSRENPKTFQSLELIMKRPRTDIPIDIICAEILPKLPVKSLLRFKTVSKSFNSLISSPAFTCLHSLSAQNRTLIVSNNTKNTLHAYHLNSLSHLPSPPSSTFCWIKGNIWITASYNGFLLVHRNTRFFLVLLNPSNRTYIDIPLPSEDCDYEEIGFGYDDINDSYKIVLVSEDFSDLDDAYTRVTSVYNVNSKSWKTVDRTSHPEYIHGRYDGGFLINRNLIHWMCPYVSNNSKPGRVVCFDVCTETWKDDVLLPSHYYDPAFTACFREFGVLDGCFFSTFSNEVDSSTDIWVMKEYRVQESWTKLLTLSYSVNLDGGVVPVAYRRGGSGEVLLRQSNGSKYVWVNLKDNTMKEVCVHDFWDNQAYICNESLVSLPGAKLFGTYYEYDETTEEQYIQV